MKHIDPCLRRFGFALARVAIVGALAALVGFSMFDTAAAASKKSRSKRSGGVPAVVKINGALVYREPDFDAEVIGSLKAGQKIQTSKGTTGEFAQFYKIRAGVLIGYVADIDVEAGAEGSETPSSTSSTDGDKASASKRNAKARSGSRSKSRSKTSGVSSREPNGTLEKSAEKSVEKSIEKPAEQSTEKSRAKSNGNDKNERSDKKKKKRKQSPKQSPLYFTRSVGASVGYTFFRENINGIDAKEGLLTYGLKITGPDVFFDGPVMDINIVLHYGAPSYYGQFSSTKPSGFVLWSDALLLIPFSQKRNSMIHFGVGPLLVLSNFKVTNSDRPMDLTALNLGLSFSLGGGVRIDKVIVRLEGKYFLEKKSYQGILTSLQTEF